MWTAERILKITIMLIAVGMSVYHLYVAFTGAPQAFFFRGTHLLFAMALVFLIYPSLVKRDKQAAGEIRDDAGGIFGAAKPARGGRIRGGLPAPPRRAVCARRVSS